MSKPGLAARLRAAFLGDLEEQLATLNGALLALEADPQGGDALNSVFRVMHTLKGAAHATDQPLVEHACHRLEAMLVGARDDRLLLGPAHFRLLFQAADALSDAARRLARQETLDGDTPIARLGALLESGALPEDVAVPAPAESAATSIAPATPGETAVRVAPEKLDALLAQVGRLLATRARIEAHRDEVGTTLQRFIDAHAALRRALAVHGVHLSQEAAEAFRAAERSLRDAAAAAAMVAARGRDDGRELGGVGDALADTVRRVRMLPFASACESLPRLVRDVATDVGKPAQLVVQGGDIEADRPVLDAARESLLHLVRNAIDHGLESPAQRAAAGKPAVGTITVRAALHGERLTVSVSDDGAGLDVATIRERLAAHHRPVPEADRDVARALFEAGFSTRDVTTSISGRGVGLDTVEATMQRVRGSVAVSWVPGEGTTFTLECPLTLAAIRAVLVRSDRQLLAIPTSNVEQLLRVRAAEVRRAQGREVVLTNGAPIPLVALADVLGPPLVATPPSDIFPALVVSAGDCRVALLVEAVESEQELVVRPIARGRSTLPHVSGGALVGSGQLVLVLNPVSLVQQAVSSRAGPGVTAVSRIRPRILVVDDSLTTRALEQSVLEAAGYDIATAVDGVDAWRQLQEFGADLLVSDIEMPNMDGLALCRAVRESERFANLPVVLVTSLDSAADRARGLSAGADAYVGKASAGQAGLLETVRQLLA